MSTRRYRFLLRAAVVLSNAEVSLCGAFALASVYYLLVREALPSTSLGRTYGDPWDWLLVVATLVCSMAVVFGRGERLALRALGLIGLCVEVLILDLTYLHLRGLTPAGYAILSNIGIVLFFAARAWLIVDASRQ